MYKKIELPYAYDALEPAIDALTVETHYEKHHTTYTDKFNKLAKKAGIADWPVEKVLAGWKQNADKWEAAEDIRNNGGGFYGHNLYFGQLSPNGGGQPEGDLATAINDAFGSFKEFKQEISQAAGAQFGSGYAWLSCDENGKLSLTKLPNQDNPILDTEGAQCPIMCIDVWEHAYYLKYKNLRPDYVEKFFDVVDWEKVGQFYSEAGQTFKKMQ